MVMLVNTTMAELSDLTFRTAFIVYLVALILAFSYYGRVNSVIEARREALAEQKVLVGAGGPEVVEKQKSDDPQVQPGMVISSNPQQGQQISPDNEIILYVAK